MEFNENQLAAIETTGTDILVSASAGSGKTAVMIERALRLIESGAKIDRMLIVTFTKAAAVEMKARLFSRLCEKSANVNCAEALKKLPQADIGTLHSFCAKLARTYFYAIEIDPAFELLGDDGALMNKCLDEIAEKYAQSERSDLYEIMLARRKDTAFKKAVKKLYLTAVGMPHPKQWLDSCLNFYGDDTEAKKTVGEFLERERKKIAAAARDCAYRTRFAKFERNIAAAESVAAAAESGEESLLVPTPRGRVEPLFIELNEEYKFLRSAVKDFFDKKRAAEELRPSKDALWCGRALKEAAEELSAAYEDEKKKSGVADYNDLEHYAYDVLSSEVGERIRDNYDYIFVDEYQDINPLQDAIIQKLKRKDNLFMVGDLKQSIYAFRGCDPSIFRLKRQLFSDKKSGKNIELNRNYRTELKIVDGVNKIFDAVMTSDFGGVNYKDEARLVAAESEGGEIRFVNVVTEKEERKKLPDVYRLSEHDYEPDINADEAESDFIVGEIIKLLSGGEAQPSDIAVLTRSKSALSYMIRDKLKAADVPAFVKESAGYAARRETAPMVNLLRLVDNAADDVALVAVLKSYCAKIGGGEQLTSDGLAKIASKRKRDEPFWQTAARDKKTASFFERLAYYTALSQSASAGEILSLVAEETDAFNEVRKRGNGDCRNISELLSAAGDSSVGEFLEKVDAEGEQESAAPFGSLKIMTVHMSKGLEFPYVFLAGIKKEFNKADFRTPYVIDRKWGLAFKYPDEKTKKFLPTFLTEAALKEGENRTLEEELRIAYVALTRAKKMLVVSGANLKESGFKRQLKQPSCPADFFACAAFETVRAETKTEVETAPKTVNVFVPSDKGGTADKIVKRIETLKKRGEAVRKKAKTSVTATVRKAWEEDGYEYGQTAHIDDDGAERGSAYHLVMQYFDFEKSAASQKEKLEKNYAQEVGLVDFEKIEKAARLVAELTKDCDLYREKEFVMDDGGTLMQGVIDLLAVRDGKAVVIDYKTGKNIDKEEYRAQLDLYARAAEKLAGLEVTGKYICALDLGVLKRLE